MSSKLGYHCMLDGQHNEGVGGEGVHIIIRRQINFHHDIECYIHMSSKNNVEMVMGMIWL